MLRVVWLVPLAGLGCSERDGAPADRPLPLTPGGTPLPGVPAPPIEIPAGTPGATVPPPPAGAPARGFPHIGDSNSAPPYESTEDRCATRPAQDVSCIDADLVPPLWTVEPDYDYVSSVAIDVDVNGDGLLDARVRLRRAGAFEYDNAIVYAPLFRELVLPTDADLHVVESFCWWGDRTGDQQMDALCQVQHPDEWLYYAGELGLVPGPLPQRIDPALDAAVVYDTSLGHATMIDTDFDGLVEPVVTSLARIELWRGDDPSTWATGTPDLTVQLPCPTYDSDFYDPSVSVCANDDEGDGVIDLQVLYERDFYDDCDEDQFYLLPAQTAGFVDVATSSIARKGSCMTPLDDQDLDGVVDFGLYHSVLAGPAVWVDGVNQSPTLFTFPKTIWTPDWTGLDFTGDGIDDWWSRDDADVNVDVPYVILSGGLGGGVTTGTPSWHVFSAAGPDVAYTEAGTNYLVFVDDKIAVRFVPIE